MKKLVPLKTSDFTGNMQALLERGEIVACNQWDGEMWAMEDRGVKVGQYIWEEKKPLLTQTRTISKYAEPMEKKLAFALMDRTLDPKIFGKFAELFYLRPTCKNIEVTPKMAAKGITNTAEFDQGFLDSRLQGISGSCRRGRGNRQRHLRRLSPSPDRAQGRERQVGDSGACRIDQGVQRRRCCRADQPQDRFRRILLPPRSVGMRQDDDAADAGRLRHAR